jgi:hypothetical protein
MAFDMFGVVKIKNADPARRNGLFGIYISGIKDSNGKTDTQGGAPWKLTQAGAPCYNWDRDKFGDWVETAYKKAHPDG